MAFDISLRLALRGQLAKAQDRLDDELAFGVTVGLRRAADLGKAEFRGAYASAGLGKLSRAWTARVFPKSGASLNAALVITGRGGKTTRDALEAHGLGVTIRGKDGLFLAVPTASAPKRGVGNKRISPATFPEGRFGRLRFVFRRPPRPSLLVVDNVRASFSRNSGALRGFRRASASALRSGRGLTTVVMFLLFPKITLRKRVDINRLARGTQLRIPGLVEQETERRLKSSRNPLITGKVG